MRSGTMALACCLTVSWAPPSIAIPGAESTHQRPGLTGQTSTGAIGQILAEVSHLRAEVAALRATRPLPPSDPLRASEPSGRAFASGDRPASSLVVTAFGALGDGTDDTAAFQRALDAAGSGGNAVVLVPAGTYTIRGHLTVPPNTELRGANNYPYRTWGNTNHTNQGTTLQAFEGAGCTDPTTAAPFVQLQGPNAGISGMSIVYPDQASPQTPQPVPYPWTLRGSGDDITIQNMFLVNPYLGIDLGTTPAGRHLVSNVYGNPLKTGIFVDQCFDVGRIRHIHFWNFWAADNTKGPSGAPIVVGPLQKWVSTHGVTVLLARTDWEVLEDVFSWGYSRGLVLANSTVRDLKSNATIGACNGQMTDLQFDAVDIGVEVQATDPYGVFFSNLNLANAGCWQVPSSGCSGVGIQCVGAGCVGSVVVRGASMWGAFKQAVVWDGPGGFALSDATVESWAPKVAAVDARAGRVSVRGCTFGVVTPQPGGVAVSLASTVQRAIVVANDLLGATIANQMPGTTSVVASNLA